LVQVYNRQWRVIVGYVSDGLAPSMVQ